MIQTRSSERPVICQLLHGLSVGGAEVLAARLARQLSQRFRFRFVCLDHLGTLGEELQRDGFPVEVLGRRPGVDWRCSVRLARLLRRQRVALVHAHQYTPFFYGSSARLLYRRPPVLFTEHGRWHPDQRRPRRVLANRLLLERRDRVVGVGRAVQHALIDNEGIPAGRVGVVYNGINLAAFRNGHTDPRAVRREMGVTAEDFVILQVARLDPLKDHATAVRTLQVVLRSQPSARLVLVGEGPQRPLIEQLVAQHGLESRVRLLGLRSDIARLLAAADVFLLTSISEGIPLTLIEAMAAGVPVVSTNVGGVGEVVEDGTTGLLAPAGDPDGLAAHVLALLDDPERRRILGRRGRERAETLFSEAQMVARYEQLYQEMLHG